MALSSDDKDLIQSMEDEGSGFDIKVLLHFIWRLKWIVLFGLCFTVPLSYIYLKLQVPVYDAASKAMFVDYGSSTNDVSIMESVTGIKQQGRRDDEIIVLQSPALMSKVINHLGLERRYFQYKMPIFHSSFPVLREWLNLKQIEYYQDAPFSLFVDFDGLYTAEALPNNIELVFYAHDESTYELESIVAGSTVNTYPDKHYVQYGDTLQFSGFRVALVAENVQSMIPGDKFLAVYTEPLTLAREFLYNLSVSLEGGSAGRSSNVLNLKYSDACSKRATDILNVLISEYNRDAKEYQSKSYISSIQFIEERLAEISAELGSVEAQYVNYQVANDYIEGSIGDGLTDNYSSQLVELNMQKTLLAMIKEEIAKIGKNSYEVIPDITGITDGSLTSTISEYNKLVLDRERLTVNSSSNNPSVLKLNDQIVVARRAVDASIASLERMYMVKEKELQNLENSARRERSYIPTHQRGLSSIARKQTIIEPLYIQLNSRKEEVQLAMYTIPDNVRVIEEARVTGSLEGAKPKKVYLIAFLIAFLLPVGVVFVRYYLRTTVETKDDVEKMVNKPILATIPRARKFVIIPSVNSRDVLTESFRMLRSNLKYVNKQVYQVTSSVPGEGKSFVAANLAVSLSHLQKKVALVGLDLRHPSMNHYFAKEYAAHRGSVVKYLIGQVYDPSEIAVRYQPDDEASNVSNGALDIFFPGSVPPNPTEILSLDRLKSLVEYCRQYYDVVLLDTAPTLLVPDASIVNNYCDATLYVVRANYTKLAVVKDMDSFLKVQSIDNVYVVLNDLDASGLKYKYGYGYGYGYSYGYGYGRGYGYGYGYGYGSSKKTKGYGYGYGNSYGYGYEPEPDDTKKSKNKDVQAPVKPDES